MKILYSLFLFLVMITRYLNSIDENHNIANSSEYSFSSSDLLIQTDNYPCELKLRLFDESNKEEITNGVDNLKLESLIIKYEIHFPLTIGLKNFKIVGPTQNNGYTSNLIGPKEYNSEIVCPSDNCRNTVIVYEQLLRKNNLVNPQIGPLEIELLAEIPTLEYNFEGRRIYNDTIIRVKSDSIY
ncbi:hypothetical protein FEE95_12790 [Maribacter algarum]|uniref:Uncharacterized protein n=1 Tax=Maribacter algarum (ex Zhang et al. 2020) TaxID=2578118 RepID=A0A5S3QIG2_9FLAO|nr:hypothetical protein [Maribacter algarum]TMM57355.1 hypothetical protein FEE95_12790 [Maribacter algarum]